MFASLNCNWNLFDVIQTKTCLVISPIQAWFILYILPVPGTNQYKVVRVKFVAHGKLGGI